MNGSVSPIEHPERLPDAPPVAEGESEGSRSIVGRLIDWSARRFRQDDRGLEKSAQSERPAQTEARDQQRQLVANVERLGHMRVSDAMVPRADVVAVEIAASFRDVVEAFRQEGHSRLPVYQDTLDDTIGFLHVKDVLLACEISEDALSAPNFMTRRYLRRLLTVPPSMPCGVLLQKMQAERVHMALVIDEFGGVDGIVTIEDLLELIVGDIEDEHDAAAEAGWTREGDNVYRTDARAYLEDFEEATGIRLLDADKLDDVDTLGGLVFMLCNRVPARGEVIRHPDGHEFEILDADPRRIKKLLVTLALPEEERSGGGEEEAPSLVQAAQ